MSLILQKITDGFTPSLLTLTDVKKGEFFFHVVQSFIPITDTIESWDTIFEINQSFTFDEILPFDSDPPSDGYYPRVGSWPDGDYPVYVKILGFEANVSAPVMEFATSFDSGPLIVGTYRVSKTVGEYPDFISKPFSPTLAFTSTDSGWIGNTASSFKEAGTPIYNSVISFYFGMFGSSGGPNPSNPSVNFTLPDSGSNVTRLSYSQTPYPAVYLFTTGGISSEGSEAFTVVESNDFPTIDFIQPGYHGVEDLTGYFFYDPLTWPSTIYWYYPYPHQWISFSIQIKEGKTGWKIGSI